jgi:hypothetical protein
MAISVDRESQKYSAMDTFYCGRSVPDSSHHNNTTFGDRTSGIAFSLACRGCA